MHTVHLFDQLTKFFAHVGMRTSKSQRANLAMLCTALAVSPDSHLSTLALALPVCAQRENLVQRLRRVLKSGLTWHQTYQPIVRHLFRHWQGAEVPLVMDRTDLGQRHSVLALGVAYCCRWLPLAWQVRSFGGTGTEAHLALLERVRPLLPANRRVTFFGDAEFRAVPLQAYCRRHFWSWHVGLKSDLLYHQDDGPATALRELPIHRGQRLFVQDVYLTEIHNFGPVNLIADWSAGQDAPRFWALDRTADRRAWRRGRKRFWCEPSFRDWKSYGFDIERSHLTCRDRLDCLLLAAAISSLWMIHIGDWLTRTGHRQLLAARHKRDYSLFRLGRDYVQRSREMNWPVPIDVTVGHSSANRADLTTADRLGMLDFSVADRRFCTRSGARSATLQSGSLSRQSNHAVNAF